MMRLNAYLSVSLGSTLAEALATFTTYAMGQYAVKGHSGYAVVSCVA